MLVDSSVWIDWLGPADTAQTEMLDAALQKSRIVLMGDLVLTEVLRGTRTDRIFDRTLATLSLFAPLTIVDRDVAITAARHYQRLRSLGITPRKTIDTLIATRCILDGLPLLYSDRDFDPFVTHLGLRSAMDLDAGVT